MERRGLILGCWDLFHIGHLRAIQKAASLCDTLTVGVYSDIVIVGYKGELPIIHEKQRLEIVQGLKYVDNAILITERPQQNYNYDIIFLGDQWINTPRNRLPMIAKNFYGQITYVPYTKEISSTKIKEWIENES